MNVSRPGPEKTQAGRAGAILTVVLLLTAASTAMLASPAGAPRVSGRQR